MSASVGFDDAIPTLFHSKLLGRLLQLEHGVPVAPQTLLTPLNPFLAGFLPFPLKCGVSFGPALDMRRLVAQTESVQAAARAFRSVLQAQIDALRARVGYGPKPSPAKH